MDKNKIKKSNPYQEFMNEQNKLLSKILTDISLAGGRAYLVGGFVRDSLLRTLTKDVDIEVYKLQPEQLEEVLKKHGEVKSIGKSFGIYKMGDIEFSIPRKERKVGLGHKDFEVILDPYLHPKKASKRRDLTINAMMYDPINKDFLDFWHGKKHIKEGIIRHVNSKTFVEDPLRVLRVAQFAGRFNFKVHPKTSKLCKGLVKELYTLPKERVFAELEKLFLKAKYPSVGFRWLKEIGAIETLFPELYNLIGLAQGIKHHPEGDAFEHTILALDVLPLTARTTGIMLAILCHDLGKAACEKEVIYKSGIEEIYHVRFHGHEQKIEPVITLLDRLTENKEIRKQVVSLVQSHMRPYFIRKNVTRKAVKKLALKVDIVSLMRVHYADICAKGSLQIPKSEIQHIFDIIVINEGTKYTLKPLISGKHLKELGLVPSPLFGQLLKKIFRAQINERFQTLEEGMEYTKQLIEKLKEMGKK